MNWKAYDEVYFSDQYILRWVREGDEYVSRISKEMMEDLQTVVRQQQAEIEALKYEKSSGVYDLITDEDLFNVYADLQENYTGNNFPVDLGRAILRKAQEK